LLVLLVGVGCNKPVNVERKVKIKSLEINEVTLDAWNQDKKLKVTIRSPEEPVDVFLVLGKDAEDLKKRLERDQQPGSYVLDQKLKTRDVTLSASVPANNEFSIFLRSSKGRETQVDLKVISEE
jgi:hypothetical protein